MIKKLHVINLFDNRTDSSGRPLTLTFCGRNALGSRTSKGCVSIRTFVRADVGSRCGHCFRNIRKIILYFSGFDLSKSNKEVVESILGKNL